MIVWHRPIGDDLLEATQYADVLDPGVCPSARQPISA